MILAAVSAETRTAPPLRTLLAVWKLTPARAATSLMETYRRAMGSCPSRERTFALLNVVSAHMTGNPVSITLSAILRGRRGGRAGQGRQVPRGSECGQ